jgi:outer membrane protein OmpA-like peptidoglycan-associated protein
MKKFKKKSSLLQIAHVVALCLCLCGCFSSMPAQTPRGEDIVDVVSGLKKGDLRLKCGISCVTRWGINRDELKELYDKKLWNELSIRVASIGVDLDLAYFYLGRSAEELNSHDAAKIYYKLGLSASYKCAHCYGFVFPDVISTALKNIDKSINITKTNQNINQIKLFKDYDTNFVNPLNLKSLPNTVSFEHTERIKRLEKLLNQLNTQLPIIDQIQVKIPSANFPIPVIRFHFDERTFFDYGGSTIRSDSNKIIDMLAEQMKQDMPDTSLVILGHTDSVGSDEYNDNLSISRSASVMQQLAQRGVNLKQMSTVGIGEVQPVATNATEDGRLQNRRIEFVLSRFEEANYVAIEQFPRNTEWLNSQPQTFKEIPMVHHNTETKKFIVFKPTKEMLVKSNSETTTILKESSRIVTIIPAETVYIVPQTQN